MKVLVIEDDQTTADYIVKGLRQEGHIVDQVANGREALGQSMNAGYDALVVDRMLPGLDGLSLVKALRAAKVTTPPTVVRKIAGVVTFAARSALTNDSPSRPGNIRSTTSAS